MRSLARLPARAEEGASLNGPDVANGSFELLGAALQWVNVRRLWQDRRVRGVDYRVWIFYTLWGGWNLWYYPSLEQWASTAGGVVMVIANLCWISLALKWRNR